MNRRPLLVAVALLVGVLAAGCDGDSRTTPDRVHADWHEVVLPLPPGPGGRVAVRDAAACTDRWFVVGAVISADGSTRPAAWTSDDARTWRSMALAPSTYYARRAILSSVACRDGRIAAVGSRSGGAHGNPRVTSWYQRADGALVDMPAAFDLYGGAEAISVRRVAAGRDGWLIAGNRLSGAAVWFSRDATDFRIIDQDPALRSDPGHATSALDQTYDGTQWTVVGRMEVPGRISPEPLAWTSPDGTHWARQSVPAGTHGFADLERVASTGPNDLVAVGLRDRHFGAWRRAGGQWAVDEAFGSVATDVTGPPFVSGLAASSGRILVSISDGARFAVWGDLGRGPWARVVTPTRPDATGDTQLTVVGDDASVLLLSDDGTSSRVWVAGWNTLGQ